MRAGDARELGLPHLLPDRRRGRPGRQDLDPLGAPARRASPQGSAGPAGRSRAAATRRQRTALPGRYHGRRHQHSLPDGRPPAGGRGPCSRARCARGLQRSNQCSVDVGAPLVARRSRDASIRNVESSASRSASFVSSYPDRRLYIDCRRRSASGNWQLRPVRGLLRCLSISALEPRRSSNPRGSSKPASEVTVAPRNSTRG